MLHGSPWRVEGPIRGHPLRQELLGLLVRGRVANVTGVLRCVGRFEHKVDELVGRCLVPCGLRNHHVIKPDVTSLTRHDIVKVVVDTHHLPGIPRVGHPDRCLVLFHVHLHLIGNDCFNVRGQLLEVVLGFSELVIISRIDRIPLRDQGHSKDIASTVDQHHIVLQTGVPQLGPVLDIAAVHHLVVIDDSQGPPEIWYRITIARIKGPVQELGINIAEVRQFSVVQGRNQVLLFHPLNRVLAGDHQVVVGSTLPNLRQHRFIAIKGLVVDVVTCLTFKLTDQGRINIIPPIINGNCSPTSLVGLAV